MKSERVKTMALYKFFSQDRPRLPRKITCESSALTQKDLEKANAEVKRSIKCEAVKPQLIREGSTMTIRLRGGHGLENMQLRMDQPRQVSTFLMCLTKSARDNSKKAKS